MVLSGPVSVRPVSMHDRTGQQRVAAVTITRGEDNLTVTLEIRCSVDSARQLASMVLGVELGIVGKDDIESTLAELANIVAGRLESGLAERDIKVSCGLPMARDEDGASSRPPHDDAIELLVSGEASGVAIAFVMS